MPGALVETAALALLHFLWEGLLIGLAAAVALRGARTAEQRHLICMAALGCCLLAPLITAAVVLPRTPAPLDLPSLSPLPMLRTPVTAGIPSSTPLLMYVAVLLWLLGALSVAACYMVRCAAVRQIRRSAFALDGVTLAPLVQSARRVLQRWRETAKVAVMASHAVLSPIVVGVWRPVIIFPAALLARMSMADFELILLHEAAHIVRRDTWANALQVCLEILLFYHPVVHWLSRRARLERECACDDFAVKASGARYEYARALASLALPPVAPLTLGASGGDLLLRLRHLGGDQAEAEAFPHSTAHLLLLALLFAGTLLLRQTLLLQSPTPAEEATAALDRSAPLPIQRVRREAPLPSVVTAPHALPASTQQEHRAHSVQAHEMTREHRTHAAQLAAEMPRAVNPSSLPGTHPETRDAAHVHRALPRPVVPVQAVHGPVSTRPPAGHASPPRAAAPVHTPVLTPIYDPAPEYPLEARMEGIQGSVMVILRIDPDGRPSGLQIVKARPQGAFEGAVRRALMRWRYRVHDGHGNQLTAAYRLTFSLAGVSSQPASICATATASRTCDDP